MGVLGAYGDRRDGEWEALDLRAIGGCRTDIQGAQIITACLLAFSHGSNDVSNATGPFAAMYSMWVNNGRIGSMVNIPPCALVLGRVGISNGLGVTDSIFALVDLLQMIAGTVAKLCCRRLEIV